MKRTVLLLSGETSVIELTVKTFAYQRVVVVSNPDEVITRLRTEAFSLLLVDFSYIILHDYQLLKRLVQASGSVSVVVVSYEGFEPFIHEAIKNGAVDYVSLPADPTVFAIRMQKYFKDEKLLSSGTEFSACEKFTNLLGNSFAMMHLKKQLELLADSDASVLLQGEPGTGKTFIAQLIHEHSRRQQENYRAVNVAAIPETLAESELMGTACGSFTGAVERQGYFEQVNGGSLLLDEIGSLSLSIQAKLLQLLESKTLYRIGSAKPIAIDVRLLFATNADLHQLIEYKSFREDLFWRMYELSVKIPPLRDRLSDIPLLTQHFLSEIDKILSCDGLDKLINHMWPGNIRELACCLRRAVVMTGSRHLIQADDIVF